jgi:hypothetical protein
VAQMVFAKHHDVLNAFPADRTVLRKRFAKVNEEMSDDLEYRWIHFGDVKCNVQMCLGR